MEDLLLPKAFAKNTIDIMREGLEKPLGYCESTVRFVRLLSFIFA